MNIGENLQGIVDDIEAVGVSASVDARDLQVPGVWVTPGVISFEMLALDEGIQDFELFLISRDNGTVASLDDLGEMLTKLRNIPDMGVHEATPVYVNLPNHGGELPALQITVQYRVN